MTGQRAYLDWNATAPMRPEAHRAMIAALDLVGNPSSVHGEGRAARRAIETAREQVAALVGAPASAVIFTSSATEANTWVLGQGWDVVFAAEVEHDSIVVPARQLAGRHVAPAVTRDGIVDLGALSAALDLAAASMPTAGKALIALQAANNETGVVQPVAGVARLAAAAGHRLLVDAVQAAGRSPLDFAALGADYLTVSGHKIGGPKGVGALVVAPDAPLAAMLVGGGQERRLRAGTENVAAIAGFGAAATAALASRTADGEHMRALRDGLEAALMSRAPEAIIMGRDAPRLPNTTCIALPGRAAEVLVAAFDLAGIAVSAGAACSSGKVGPSRVLAAMGVDPALALAAIRISLGPTTTENDIAAVIAAWTRTTAARRRAA